MNLARVSRIKGYVNRVVDKAEDHKQPSRLAALGAYAVKSQATPRGAGSSASSASFEYSGGFCLPKVPAIPGNDAQMTQALSAETVSPVHIDPECRVELKLPGLSTEEWQIMTGAKKSRRDEASSSKRDGRSAKKTKQSPMDVDVPLHSGKQAEEQRGPVADDDVLRKMQRMGMNMKEGAKVSVNDQVIDGIGVIQSLSANHKNRLIKDLLNQYDTDKSGTFDQKELLPVMQAVTAELYPTKKIVITEEDTDFVMKSTDSSGDGKLDHSEFIKALDFWDFYCNQKKEIDSVINRYDHDMSGKLDQGEFAVLMQDIAKLNGFQAPNEHEVSTMFKLADINQSGVMERIEIMHALTTYVQAKKQQALGNLYHPILHEWIKTQLEYLFYFVPNHDWHSEVYSEISKMKPWARKLAKYLEEVVPAALKMSTQGSKGKAQLQAQVMELIPKFCQQLEQKQKYENETNPWVYAETGEMDMWEESGPGKRKAAPKRQISDLRAIQN